LFKFLLKRQKKCKTNNTPGGEQRINLLIEVGSFDKGGLEKLVMDMALLLDREKFHVSIVSMGPVGFLGQKAIDGGVSVFDLSGRGRKQLYREILRDQKITLTNSHFSHYGYPLFKERKIPNVTFIHNVYAFLNSRQLSTFIRCDKYVNKYIAVSNNAARYATAKLGVDRRKVEVIPNGLDIEEYQRKKSQAPLISRTDFGVGDDDYLFLNVASYNLHKGHYLMADAMKRILQVRDDIKILCIGNPVFPPHVEGLKAYLKEQKLDRHIRMPGFYPNVESFYDVADAFLQPSFIEGWSIAMNEAMFFGKPMILTKTGAAPEVIQGNDIGILIDNEYGDILNLDSSLLDSLAYHQRSFHISEMLARTMIEFADNKERWKAAGERGNKKLMERYDIRKIIERYEAFFWNVI
jgi:glycosyltransferase involved in cell wall biosynthesis